VLSFSDCFSAVFFPAPASEHAGKGKLSLNAVGGAFAEYRTSGPLPVKVAIK